MTLPSLDYQRGRETGVQAERHHWRSRLQDLWEQCDTRALTAVTPMRSDAFRLVADKITALLAERP